MALNAFALSRTVSVIMPNNMTHPHLHEFVLLCAGRAGHDWPDLYDEMCYTAARKKYRGLGYAELRELGLPLDLNGLDTTAALVDSVLAGEIAS